MAEKPKFLIVEDREGIADHFARELRETGRWDVETCRSAAEFGEQHYGKKKFTAALVDPRLDMRDEVGDVAEASGFTIAKWLKDEGARVVVYSWGVSEQMADRAAQIGVAIVDKQKVNNALDIEDVLGKYYSS